MSFASDIARWAEEEWYRRHISRPKNIESILYPPHRSERQSARRKGVAPHRGIGTPPYPRESDPTTKMLEHGMLIRSIPTQAAPPDVHHTLWLTDYLNGQGTSIPTGIGGYYLIGPMHQRIDDGSIAWTKDPSYWLSNPYSSQVWTDQDQWSNLWPLEISLQSNRWTGLMRLWVQCLLGANRSPSDAFSSAYPLRAGQDGIFRMWDPVLTTYQYWFIRSSLNDGSVWANPCTTSFEGQIILEWLNAHKRGEVTLTDDTRSLYDAWILRDLTVGAGTQIADNTVLGQIWESNATEVAHGWAYSRQRIGSPLEDVTKASIVTHGVTLVGSPQGVSRWHAQHYHLAFSLSNGVISVAVELQEGPTDWTIITALGPMWYPRSNMTEYEHWDQPANYIGDSSVPVADVPFYCYWADDREVVSRFNMEFSRANDVDTDDYGPIQLCGTGGGSKSYKNLSVLSYGGPYIDGVTDARGTVNKGTSKEKTFSVGKIGEVVKGAPGSIHYEVDPAGKQFCEIPEGCWKDGWYRAEPFCYELRNTVYGEFVYDLVQAVESENIFTTNLWSLERPLIITTDPEAVYSVFHQRITGSQTATVWDFTSNNLSGSLTTGGKWRWDSTQYDFKMNFGSRGGYYWGSNPGTGMGPTGSNNDGPLNPPTSETTTPIDEITDFAYLVTPEQTRSLPIIDGGWASYFYTTPMLPQGITVDSNRSYYNGSGYYSTSKSKWVTTDSIPFTYGDGLLLAIGLV